MIFIDENCEGRRSAVDSGQSLPQQSRTPSGGPGDPISQEHVAACSGPQERRAGLAGHSERELQLKYLAPRDGPARNSPSEREPICIELFDRGHCLCAIRVRAVISFLRTFG